MADLNELQSAGTTKIIGSTAAGVETTPAKVSPNQDVGTSDILDNGGAFTAITVGLTAVELKVGVDRLANRKYVVFQAKDTGVFMGLSSGVLTTTGIEIFKDQLIMMPVGENTQIWFIATGAGKNVRIQELA